MCYIDMSFINKTFLIYAIRCDITPCYLCVFNENLTKIMFDRFPDIEAQILEIQKKKKEIAQTTNDKGVGLLESGYFDSEFYDDGVNNKNRYETSIAANDADDADEEEDEGMPMPQSRATYTAPKAVLKDIVQVSVRNFNALVFQRRIRDHSLKSYSTFCALNASCQIKSPCCFKVSLIKVNF